MFENSHGQPYVPPIPKETHDQKVARMVAEGVAITGKECQDQQKAQKKAHKEWMAKSDAEREAYFLNKQAEERALTVSNPFAPESLAKMGLTSLVKAVGNGNLEFGEKFNAWLAIITDPEQRVKYPSYIALSQELGVSIETLKAWKMTAEAAKGIELTVAQDAKMAMPEVLKAMVEEAKGGNPKAAQVVMNIAQMGQKQVAPQAQSMESALQSLVLQRVRTVKVVEVVPQQGGK